MRHGPLVGCRGGGSSALTYVVTDLGTLEALSYATGINSSGVVVGYTYPAAPTLYPAAFIYSGGTIRDLC